MHVYYITSSFAYEYAYTVNKRNKAKNLVYLNHKETGVPQPQVLHVKFEIIKF